jgi:hypothetical protein
MELSKFAEFQRNPILEVGDYVYINPQYCETEDEKFTVYVVYDLYKDGTAIIVPLKDDPDTILKQQTFIHKDKLYVIYEP